MFLKVFWKQYTYYIFKYFTFYGIGYDFNNGIDYEQLLSVYRYSGFQATNFGLSVEQINKMVRL